MPLGPKDVWVAEQLTENDENFESLIGAFETVSQPFTRGVSVQELHEAYTTAGWWYAEAKDRKRGARAEDGTWQAPETKEAQHIEDYMEALVKSLDKALMVAMHLAKHGG